MDIDGVLSVRPRIFISARILFNSGTRNVAFASGGFLPAALRNTASSEWLHIADFWATFAALAGAADPTADPKAAAWNKAHSAPWFG